MGEMISEDMALVREYGQGHSEQAFATLVSRHVNLVYSVALRHVRDPHLAEEITQGVFIILARKAKSLSTTTILSGWLCRTARYVSADTLKIQRRRRMREQESQMQSTLNEPEPCVWNQIAPLLDEALNSLGAKEHDAVVLRFLEGQELKQVGAAMGTTEDAARMRVNRGLEKLRKFFTKRGVRISAEAIAGAVAANSVQAAPAALAATVSAAALCGTTLTTAAVIAAIKGSAMTAIEKAFITATITMLAGAAIYEAREVAQLRDKAQTLRQQQTPFVEQIQRLQGESEGGARKMASLLEGNETLKRTRAELAGLRRQAGILRSQLDELKLVRNQQAQARQSHPTETSANQGSASRRPIARILVTHIKQPQEVSEEKIRTRISIKAGDLFDREAVDLDVRNLYNTGWFQAVRVAQGAADGGVVLNYLVQERPRISTIRFTGNTKLAEASLAQVLASKVDESLNERTVFDDAQKITELYKKSGLANAEVKYSCNVNEDVGIGEVTFEIAE